MIARAPRLVERGQQDKRRNLGRYSPPSLGAWALFVCSVAAAFILLVPYNYVRPFEGLNALLGTAIAAATLCATLLTLKNGWAAAHVLLGVSAVLSIFAIGNGASPLSTFFGFAPILIGFAVSARVGRKLLVSIVAWGALVLFVEYVQQRHVYSTMIGTPFHVMFQGVEFRARGFFGHAVPAALTVTAVSFAAMQLFWSSRRAAIAGVAILALWLAAVVMTGTRSAILLALMLAAAMLVRRVGGKTPRTGLKVRWWGMPVGLLSIAGVVVAIEWFPFLSTLRAFDFSVLTGSISLGARLSGPEVLASLPDSCGLPCGLIGHGGRSLEGLLISGAGVYDLSTIDNQFISLIWDYGYITLGFVVVLGIALFAKFLKSDSEIAAAGALLGLGILFSGLFYDSLYTGSSALILGVGIGMAYMPRNRGYSR